MLKTLILGNGFDLALNIKTSYKDFIDSDEYDDNRSDFEEIANYIEENMVENPLWSGIESDLLNYINEKIEEPFKSDLERYPDGKKTWEVDKINAIDNFKIEFKHLKLVLNEYLLNIQNKNRACMPYVDKKIQEIIRGASEISVYTFNFTNFYKRFFDSPITKIFHLHDRITDYNNTNIIFGIESDDLDGRLYDFITKSLSHNYKYYKNEADIIQNRLKESDEIYFYGYSFGDSDSTLVTNIFKPENFKSNTKIELIAESPQSITKMKANISHIISSRLFKEQFAHRIDGVVV
jgi:hypothetical protein